MSNYCVFNNNGIKSIEQITFWRYTEKVPPTILFMTPSGVYLYVQKIIDNIVKPLGIVTTMSTTVHEFYKYYENSSETWLMSIDISDHKKWKLVENIESIHLHY